MKEEGGGWLFWMEEEERKRVGFGVQLLLLKRERGEPVDGGERRRGAWELLHFLIWVSVHV